jgi:hypothetical protein
LFLISSWFLLVLVFVSNSTGYVDDVLVKQQFLKLEEGCRVRENLTRQTSVGYFKPIAVRKSAKVTTLGPCKPAI